MEFIKNQYWRYATKQFDNTKKISTEHLEQLKEAIQLSASSYGLQLYKVLIIEDPTIREQLKPVSWGQSQITDASQLIVFCNDTVVTPTLIDAYIDRVAATRGIKIEDLKGYGDFMKNKLAEKSTDEQFNWTKQQTYIALGNLLSACAELKIDACPMEGFEPEEYNKILGLTEKGLNAAVIATIGYRSDSDATQNLPKVRKPMDALFETI